VTTQTDPLGMIVRALRVGSSKQSGLLRSLAAALPALLQHRPRRDKLAKPRQRQRRLTAEQAEQLIAEYQAGDDMTVLAGRWGMHRTTVAAQLQRAGVELRRQGVPADRLDEALRLYREGWSCQRLAERYDCDDETVRHVLKRAGVTLRAPWERP
jgi:lambda repressor-like predicted transcriptional regulator